MSKIKIGIVGEDPNDTDSISFLISKSLSENVYFKKLIRNIRGYQLDNPKAQKSLKIEFETQNPNFVILIRDLDGLKGEKDKEIEKQNWFNSMNKVINNKGLFLLNIYELEALIYANIEVFNSIYDTTIKQDRNPMFIKEPKEKLIDATKRVKTNKKIYQESDAPEIFNKLKFDVVVSNCLYFREFITALSKLLA